MSRMVTMYTNSADVDRKLIDEDGSTSIESGSLIHHQPLPEYFYHGDHTVRPGLKGDSIMKLKSDNNVSFISGRMTQNEFRSLNDNIDVEMRPAEEETVSTIDSSTLSQQQAFNSAAFHYSGAVQSGAGKHPASHGKMKKEKPPSKKMRTDEEEEEIDIDKCITEDPSRVSVKILRKVIPKLRIACYYSDQQVSGKRKLKHLWDEKPADWPNNVPFKDPNNAITKKSGKDDSSDWSTYGGFKDASGSVGDILAKKPGKEELTPMYEFLRKKYMEKKSANGEMNNGLLTSGVYQETVYLASSPNISHSSAAIYPASGYSNPIYGSATLPPSASEDSKDAKPWSRTISQFQQPYVSYTPEDDRAQATLAPTTRRAPHHQLLVTHPETSNYETLVREPVHVSNRESIPAPVIELFNRLAEKRRQVEMISVHDGEGKSLLASVQKEVIDCLFDKLSSDDTRLCLMFLDAGHQFEALLDVMLVLGVADSGVLLSNGCQEILKKFNKDCVTTMTALNILQPRVSVLGMLSDSIRSAVYGLPPKDLCGTDSPASCKTADDKDQLMNGYDSWTHLGVVKRPAAGQAPMPCADIEIRVIDPEKTNSDDQEEDILAKLMKEIIEEDENVNEGSEHRMGPLVVETKHDEQIMDLDPEADELMSDLTDVINKDLESGRSYSFLNSSSSFQLSSPSYDSLSSPFQSAVTIGDETSSDAAESCSVIVPADHSSIPLFVANYDEEFSGSSRNRYGRRRGSRGSTSSYSSRMSFANKKT